MNIDVLTLLKKKKKTVMIELSVGIPLFKSDKIAWLPMESLCNQIGIDFEWELIACEEYYHENDNAYCGKDYFESYRDRLYKVGCRDIKFIDLENFITLENKWKLIVNAANKHSKVLVLQASDNYSQVDRLKNVYDLIKQGADWIHYKKIYFYNCRLDKMILRNVENYEQSKGTNISIRLKLLQDLPYRNFNRGVDSWLYEMAKRNGDINEMWCGGLWETGVCTDGFNRISLMRKRNYKKTFMPFYDTDKNINDILPADIVSRLKGIAK